jgi:hypothetical protein
MKSYRQFCKDANIIEDWNLFSKSTKSTKPKPSTEVLAYKNYKPGSLDKSTGKFTQRAHSGTEQNRYGWKPVNVSSYSKADTPGPLTASGDKFHDKAKLVAVPYASKTSSKPSIPFGTNLQMTRAPGTKAPVATTKVSDTGNFGAAGDYNKSTSFDLARQTAADVSGKPNITAQEFGKQKVYVRNAPAPTVSAKTKPTK